MLSEVKVGNKGEGMLFVDTHGGEINFPLPANKGETVPACTARRIERAIERFSLPAIKLSL